MQFIDEKEQIESISLFDLAGNKISTGNENELLINHSPGIYLIKITTKSGKIEIHKLIIAE